MAYLTNAVSAIQPELWSQMVQVPLYKSLVALEVANLRLSDTLRGADTIHVPYFDSLSASTYVPGSAINVQTQAWKMDTMAISTYKHVAFYIDDPAQLTLNVDQVRDLSMEAAYQLKDAIDQHVFSRITGANGFTAADDQDLLGGTNAKPVSAGTANIINLFAGARAVLRSRNVEETGDWCAVVTPTVAKYIEIKAASVGFNVADATLRNGYAGDFMGFQVYISNNLPSGKMTAIAPGAGGVTATGLSATTGKSIYFGKKGTIDAVLMRQPAVEIRKVDNQIGSNYIVWTVYGSTVLTKNKSRGINVPINASGNTTGTGL